MSEFPAEHVMYQHDPVVYISRPPEQKLCIDAPGSERTQRKPMPLVPWTSRLDWNAACIKREPERSEMRAERSGQVVCSWIDVKGRRLHARVSADAAPIGSQPVVLVHGLLVSSRYMVPLARQLASSFSVYAPDLPGYGRSVKPRKVLDVPALADALVDYLKAAGLGSVALVANSLGCQIAVDCAARHPRWVSKLVLLGPTVDPSSRPWAKLAARWLLNVPLEPVSLDFVALRDLLDMGPWRLLLTFRAMLDDRIETKLPLVRAPTLVVRGGRDSTVSQDWAERVVRLLPRGRLAVVPGVAHTVNYNSPREVAQLVRTFVDSPVEGGLAARMG